MMTRLLINGELVVGDGEPIDVLDPDRPIRHGMIGHA